MTDEYNNTFYNLNIILVLKISALMHFSRNLYSNRYNNRYKNRYKIISNRYKNINSRKN